MARALGFTWEDTTISAPRVIATSSGSIVADPTSLTDANYPGANNKTTGYTGVLNCMRHRSIFLGVEMADGSALGAGKAIRIEPLIYDVNGAANRHWKRLLAGGSPISVVLDDSGFQEVFVGGRTIFLRVAEVIGSITADVNVLGFPGQPLPW